MGAAGTLSWQLLALGIRGQPQAGVIPVDFWQTWLPASEPGRLLKPFSGIDLMTEKRQAIYFSRDRAPAMGKTRVLIADDHAIMRVGIKNILIRSSEIDVVGEAANGAEALKLVHELRPDVLILDMEMPVMDGIETARRLQAMNSPVRILVLSAYDDRQYILEMLNLGASGYLIKDEAPEVIVDAVQGVANGDKGWISRKAALRVQR